MPRVVPALPELGARSFLLHGWPQHSWCWRELIPRLAEHHRVLAPDLRGWGWSEAPPGDYAKATFAEDILALVATPGLGTAAMTRSNAFIGAIIRAGRPPDLKIPILLVMGSRSLIQRVVEPQPSRNLQVRVIEGAGQFLPEEAPEQVLDLALGFLDGRS